MQSLFDSTAQQDIFNRLDKLSETTQPNWGKMSVGQMLKHCQMPLNIANGTYQMKEKAGFLKKLMFSMMKPLLYNDKPWKQNLPTPKEFMVTTPQDFSKEKETLTNIINEFTSKKNANFPPHPFFGKFTNEQWGKMQYKHLDHHLKQFGV
jgi:hypothetical protein